MEQMENQPLEEQVVGSSVEEESLNATIKEKFFSAKRIAWFSVLFALVIVLQLWGSSIRVGTTTLSFVLVPIVLCGILLGVTAGTVLGLIFGVCVILFNGLLLPDGFTSLLLVEQPFLTALTCIVKGVMAGFVPALVYRFLKKKHKYLGTFVSAILAPIMNTGFFILCALLMSGTISKNFAGDSTSVIYFLVIGCAGVNFLIELAINVLLAPALYRVIDVVERYIIKK